MRQPLVTGGSFIGRHLVALLPRDRRVRILDLHPLCRGIRIVVDASRKPGVTRFLHCSTESILFGPSSSETAALDDMPGAYTARRYSPSSRIAAGMESLADHLTHRPPAAAVRSKALSSEKSRRELDYMPHPIEPTLQEAIEGIPGGSRSSVPGWRAGPLGRPVQEASGS